jgi:lysophospholipase L1-like esterase
VGLANLAAPTISPQSEFFNGEIEVSISTTPSDAAILFTLDGTNPQTSATAITYTAPFILTQSATVNAIARQGGNPDSEVSSRTFTATTCPITSIMPIGDSITAGIYGPVAAGPAEPDRAGYRGPLYRSLVDNGYVVDFAGQLSAGYALVPQIDPNHEGRSGWSDDQIAANVYSFLDANPSDVILLHIGTNALETEVSGVEATLNEIDRYEADTGKLITVVLAKIINRAAYSATTSTFNNNLENMALARIAAGDSLIIVDQESALIYPDDMFDNLHPNSVGYEKMATVWNTALQSLLIPCGN